MKRNLFLGVCLAAFIAPTGVKAQYPPVSYTHLDAATGQSDIGFP